MEYIKRNLSLILLMIVAFSCSQPNQDDKISILFIGNSYTYYNSTPELLKSFILEKFPEQEVETRLISGGGMTLSRHWEDAGTIEAIRSGEWDYVVLQEQSQLGMPVMIDDNTYFGQTEQFFKSVRAFDAEIRKAGAKTVFFMTWSIKDKPEQQAILTHAYASITNELDAIVAPIGLAWDKVRTDPKINLYADDGGHPSPIGSYLAATTLYATLMGDDPRGLSEAISGNRLSNTGEPSLDRELLIDLSTDDAQLIQKASWEVVKAMKKSSNYLNFKKPEPTFTIPVLIPGEAIQLKNMTGKWYGTSTYGSDYLGQIMKVEEVEGKPKMSLSFYSPHGKDEMIVENSAIKEDQLILTIYDSSRARNSIIRLSLNNNKIEGILESAGNFYMYKHLNFSRNTICNDVDLSAVELLMQSLESNIIKEGYVKAVINHYDQYSKLIGETYKPEEFYLNAVGYNFLQDGKVNDALNTFELAMTYYPQSVNTYDSYAEALIAARRKDEALEVYTKAYELAKETGYERLAYIEENLNKLKNNESVNLEGEEIPPPPPPQ